MPIVIKEITASEGMDDFLSIPSEIYLNDQNWIAPVNKEIKRILDPLVNPYFKNSFVRMFLGYVHKKAVCRAIMVINPFYWKKFNRKTAFFGFFESLNDSEAVRCLFETIGEESKKAGAEYLEGPFNPNHYSELGILTDNFDTPPAFFETYNPSYYPALLEDAGMTVSNIFHTRVNYNIHDTLKSKYRNTDNGICKDIKIRKFNIFRFKRDMSILREINNDSFKDNKYFLPLSKEEYLFSAKYLFLVTKPSLILIAEYKGEPVGAVQLVTNLNCILKKYRGIIKFWNIPSLLWKSWHTDELIVFTTGIKEEYRSKRIFTLLLRSSVKIFRKYSTLSTTWIADDDLGKSLSVILGMAEGKHFAIFSKQLI
jgi:hypothetical protein